MLRGDGRRCKTSLMPKLLPLLALLLAAGVPQAVLAADTVFVVRHMQKADGADPPLST